LAMLGTASVEVLEAELSELGDLVDRYRHSDELLERLLDPETTVVRREEILESLKAQRLLLTRNRMEAERLRARSQQLLRRSVQLIGKAGRQIYQMQNDNSTHAPELCGYCEGFGTRAGIQCPACDGKRTILVQQPAIKCPRCKGDGKVHSDSGPFYYHDFC